MLNARAGEQNWIFCSDPQMGPRRALLRDRRLIIERLWLLAAIFLGVVSPSTAQIPKPTDAPRPLSPEESAKRFHVPAGFRVDLVAAEPLIHEPSGVCWDAQGRMFVCELHGYNLEGQYDIEELNKTGELDHLVRRLDADPAAKQAAAADTYGTVKLLSDTDGDGRMDKASTWADRLPPCYGVCPAQDGVIVVCAPSIVYLADRDGDICALADQPAEFARRVVDLLRDPQKAAEMAARAREEVVTKRDIRGMTERLVEGYRAEVLRRNAS